MSILKTINALDNAINGGVQFEKYSYFYIIVNKFTAFDAELIITKKKKEKRTEQEFSELYI